MYVVGIYEQLACDLGTRLDGQTNGRQRQSYCSYQKRLKVDISVRCKVCLQVASVESNCNGYCVVGAEFQYACLVRNRYIKKLLTSDHVHRVVMMSMSMFSPHLMKRVKATVLYATETGKSERYAKDVGNLFSHAFAVNVSKTCCACYVL